MWQENYYTIDNATLYAIYRYVENAKYTLLFIHGLGDSHLNYQVFFKQAALANFSMIAVDLLGYGKSSKADHYNFAMQTTLLQKQIQHLAPQQPLIVIGHSMSSIPAMRLCESTLQSSIAAVVLLEGSVTQYGSFIAEKVANLSKDINFEAWFEDFKQTILTGDLGKTTFGKLYYTGLVLSDPKAFFNNAVEMYRLATTLLGDYTSLTGAQFVKLNKPKVYFCRETFSPPTQEFLSLHKTPIISLSANTHWVAQELPEAFSNQLARFIVSYHPIALAK